MPRRKRRRRADAPTKRERRRRDDLSLGYQPSASIGPEDVPPDAFVPPSRASEEASPSGSPQNEERERRRCGDNSLP